jgi:HAD superfamily hydrolase (TIGR01509 family)
MREYDAAIFDLDGTLIDSMSVWDRVDEAFLGRRGIPVTEDYTAAVSAMCFSEAAQYTISRYGFPDTPEELIAEWNGMVLREYAENIALKPHARELLDRLRGQGVRLGVATALPEELYGPVLRRNEVFDRFSAFASVCEAAHGKGFPDVYLLTAQRLGVRPERCVVFEDVLPGIRGAKAAGMTAYGVYDFRAAADEPAMRALADGYLLDLSDFQV